MALGVPDKKKNPGNSAPLGVPTKPNTPPANLMGQPKSTGPSVPEYSGPPPPPGAPAATPGVGPTLPPSTGPIFPPNQGGPGGNIGGSPIAFNGGTYNPTTAPYGFDMSAPGVGEQFWNQNQDLWFQSPSLDWVDSALPQFQDPWYGETWNQDNMSGIGAPGAGQQYWNGVKGDFNSMSGAESAISGGYKGPNNAQEAYNMTKGMLPGSLQPQFDSYYDRMKDKVMSDVNSQSAARGAYGSNTALNNTIGAGLDVEAQRAKAATDFSLADSANQMGWQGLLGNQARGADLSGLGIFGSNLQASNYGLDKARLGGDLAFRAEEMDYNKDRTMSDIAFGIDDARRNRLDSGISTAFGSDAAHRGRLDTAFDASNRTQDQREDRVGGLYSDVSDFSGDVMGFFEQNYDQILNADEATFDEMMNTMISQTADQRGWDQQQQERIMRDAKAIYDMIKGTQTQGVEK